MSNQWHLVSSGDRVLDVLDGESWAVHGTEVDSIVFWFLGMTYSLLSDQNLIGGQWYVLADGFMFSLCLHFGMWFIRLTFQLKFYILGY